MPLPNNVKTLTSSTIPAANSSAWPDLTATLREFLTEPRTWKDLSKWAKRQGQSLDVVRHQLAWLEENRLAVSLIRGEVSHYLGKTNCRAIRWVDPTYLTHRSQQIAAGLDPVTPMGLLTEDEMPANYWLSGPLEEAVAAT